uniref:Heme exporter protein D n=1 Tax=Cereibacter sphaeroides (strain ATCC 17025 / ATH 2.4.3) TaxID=349102 RepID=A4WZ58_CERS5
MMNYLIMEYVLTFGTIGFVLVLAYINIRQTEKQLEETRKRRQAQAVPAAE